MNTTTPNIRLCPRKTSAKTLRLISAMAVALPFGAAAADWPQWRFDANRSAATEDSVAADAGLLWELDLGRPDPAYDHQYRMCADVTYAPVAGEGLVFIPSNSGDHILACELATGRVRWRFLADAPVRFAPVYHSGKVHFVSDDGYLYCVGAQDGKLAWRVRGAPEALPDSRMLVNGRLCSRWPARGAPVLHGGTIMFGAGIWPEEGVYVCAVDAANGKLLWRTDALSLIRDGMSDHSRAYDLSLPPQGYLAVIDGKLAVPSGRSLAVWLDPADGKLEPYTCYYLKTSPPRGTWYLSGINHYCVQGGNWFGTRPDAAPPLPESLQDAKPATYWSKQPVEAEQYVIRNRPFLAADTYRLHDENLYTEPVLTETTLYTAEFAADSKYLVPRGHTHVSFPKFDRIVARDLTRPVWQSVAHPHVMYGRAKTRMPRLEFPVLWELESPLRLLLKAGDRLYAGGENALAAISIPTPGKTPSVAWQQRVNGTPVEALVADGKLVAVTDTGRVLCFGAGGGKKPAASESTTATPKASPPGGYSLVLGVDENTGDIRKLADANCRVIIIDPDSRKVATARRELASGGLYGRSVQVLQGDFSEIDLAPYWANRIIVNNLAGGASPERTIPGTLELLRPYTGTLTLAGASPHAAAFRRMAEAKPGYRTSTDGDDLKIVRIAPPPGASEWTHEAGGPDNRFANAEQNVKWPLATLWYSGDIDRYFTPPTHFQHERHPYPLVVNGRMFIITGHLIHAVDIYTGNYLWQAAMPETPYVKARNMDSRSYGRPTERNCVAAKDWLYTVTGEEVHAFDLQTGHHVKTFTIPASLGGSATTERHAVRDTKGHGGVRDMIQYFPQWTEVRLWQDLLIAMLGDHLVAFDRHSGDVRWMRKSTREITTYAIGSDTLFGLDCDEPDQIGGTQSKEPLQGLLAALDPATGKPLWERPFSYSPVPKHEVANPRPWLRPVVPVLAHSAKHGLLVVAVNRSDVTVLKAADGSELWSRPGVAGSNIQDIYPPVVTDDHLLLFKYQGNYAYLLDILTGKDAGPDTGIPQPRTCARVIGNDHLMVYRDASTEIYDVDANRMVRFNSLRSGCTTSFIPAGGVMAAPMLGHGCVCNYPMFASIGLYHSPGIDQLRPDSVKNSWGNQLAVLQNKESKPPIQARTPVDITPFVTVDAEIESVSDGLRLITRENASGFAIRKAERPLSKGVLSVSLRRAGTQGRHGNAFIVLGNSAEPARMIICRIYFGGRDSIGISGDMVEKREEKITFTTRHTIAAQVEFDCPAGTVSLNVGENVVKTRITGDLPSVTHYGYGGAHADNIYTPIRVK